VLLWFCRPIVRAMSGRAVSASRKQTDRELWTLRDNVLRLQQQLAVSQAQLHNANRQFSCLVDSLHKYVRAVVVL